jgi:serine/threonine-protein kinase RsbW
MTTQDLNESYPAVAESVPRAREALTTFARSTGASQEQVDALRLAASEALTNAVLHAYNGESGEVHVTAARTCEDLWVLIADDGRGLQIGSESRGLGMGLALIACTTDYFAVVKRSSGGTEIRMRFGGRLARRLNRSRAPGSLASARAA